MIQFLLSQSNIPLFLALGALGLSGWGVFLLFATNSEKLSSSVTRQVVENIRANDELRDVLGDAVRPEPTWYMNGEPYISGAVRISSSEAPRYLVLTNALIDQHIAGPYRSKLPREGAQT